MPRPCTGVILAGGAAQRFGGAPKGLRAVGGRRIVDRVADALRPVSDALLIVSNDPDAAQWLPGVRTAADLRPGCGSLGGIHAALVHAGTPALVVAWDMPFVPAALLAEMRSLAGRYDVDAVVPESDGRWRAEPLCAYYAQTCIPVLEQRLADRALRVGDFLDAVRVKRVPTATVRAYGNPTLLFLNVNTPDDLTRANEAALRD